MAVVRYTTGQKQHQKHNTCCRHHCRRRTPKVTSHTNTDAAVLDNLRHLPFRRILPTTSLAVLSVFKQLQMISHIAHERHVVILNNKGHFCHKIKAAISVRQRDLIYSLFIKVSLRFKISFSRAIQPKGHQEWQQIELNEHNSSTKIFIHPFSSTYPNPHCWGTGANPNSHRAKGGVYPGQTGSLSEA